MEKVEMVKWQEECYNSIVDKENVILSSPTGSGKTKVFLEWALSKSQRPIYITAPIKALSNQRYRELKNAGYVVGIETGDIKKIPRNCEFMCCTQEIYTNKYINDKDVTLIIDEFHYIFENYNRARTYIDALKYSKAKNILVCSATLGNIEKTQKYINDVTGREFFVFQNTQRLTTISYKGEIPANQIHDALVICFSNRNCISAADGVLKWRRKQENKNQEIMKKNQIRAKEIRKLANKYEIKFQFKVIDLNMLRYGVAVYYSALLPKEKLFIENLFEERIIDVVVGTDALSLGVNFPVQNVIFTQFNKYDGTTEKKISKNLFDQLAGRAGRKRYFDKGNIYYSPLLSNAYEYSFNYEYNKEHLSSLYKSYLKMPNEEMCIRLTPKISQILENKKTIQEEAEYIVNYSTEKLDLQDVMNDITTKIKYIKEFDIKAIEELDDDVFSYYNWYDDYDSGEERLEKDYNVYDSDKMEQLQKEFNSNISRVYFDEYDEVENCKLFSNILKGKGIEELMLHCNIYSLLQLRVYIKRLPIKYRENLDISVLENKINNIDSTVFNIQ